MNEGIQGHIDPPFPGCDTPGCGQRTETWVNSVIDGTSYRFYLCPNGHQVTSAAFKARYPAPDPLL